MSTFVPWYKRSAENMERHKETRRNYVRERRKDSEVRQKAIDIAARSTAIRRGIVCDDIVAWRNATFLAQDGICAMEDCNDTAVCIDHDHVTGKPRAMLCHRCNIALGLYEGRGEIFSKYLEKF